MLTGPNLGAAIEAARIAKNMSKKALAEQFGVKPPSVQGWINTGRIDKAKLIELITFFADTVPSEHWGLSAKESALVVPRSVAVVDPAADPPSVQNKASAADKVMEMLQKHGKGLSGVAKERIAQAVAESLAEAPLDARGVAAGDDLAVIRVRPGELSIPQYDVRGSMGAGEIPDDYVRHIRNVIISEDMVREMSLTFTSPTNLCFMTGSGQSMEGTINDKSPLLVDRGVQSFIGDGVYAFTWEGFFNVKRLQLLDSERVEIISDNPTYGPRTARIEDLFVHARVLVAWNAKKL